ncbi:amidohydrolase family protein [Rhodohalobacter sp. 614A]|uniref:amidohydrolase family protein n=1 Tax=Rhodohalobacter sp. 614A TaxID=2908649 RepID=UPI001F1BB97E|nr:amidohydrolase family protein [Rhodohalobacter sp. 614A]
MKKTYLLWAVLLLSSLLPLLVFAQSPPAYALENVTIHQSDGSVIESGTIVWRDGVIEAVGRNAEIPFDAFSVIDGGDSLHVYPGFIDGLGTWGSPDLPSRPEQVDDPGNPGYERAGIQPERSGGELLDASGIKITDVMKAGITTANLGLKGYMLAGQPDLYFLNGEETTDYLFRESTGYQFAFQGAAGGWSSRAYPSTTMGVMAQFRQLMYDAEALQDHIQYFADANGNIQAPKRDKVLESLFPVLNGEAKLFANVDSPEDFERLMILNDEFGLDIIIVSGKSMNYKASELEELGIPVLASIEFPEKPKWMKDDEEDSEEESISSEEQSYRERQEKAYNSAIKNIKTLLDEDVRVGFASAGLNADKLLESLRTLKEEGDLSDEEILQILTVNTAEILESSETLGQLESGFNASFAVFDSPFLDEKAKVKMVISNGEIHEF